MKNERFLTQADADAIARLTESLLRVADTEHNAGEYLLDLLSTATLLPPEATRPDAVALRSEVSYQDLTTGSRHTLIVVPPPESDAGRARVSVLAPVPLALLGCRAGDVVSAPLPFGRTQTLRILEVRPPSALPA